MLLLLFLLQEITVARIMKEFAITIEIPVHRECLNALIFFRVHCPPINAAVHWTLGKKKVRTFYLSIKSLCLQISSLGLHILQWNLFCGTPLFKGHLYSGDSSIQGTPLFRGQLFSRDTSIPETPLFKGHLYSGDTSIQGTSLFRGHLYSRDTYIPGHLYSSDTSIQGRQNLVPEECPYNLWIYYLYTSIKGKWTLSLGPETRVYYTSIKFLGFTLYGATPHNRESGIQVPLTMKLESVIHLGRGIQNSGFGGISFKINGANNCSTKIIFEVNFDCLQENLVCRLRCWVLLHKTSVFTRMVSKRQHGLKKRSKRIKGIQGLKHGRCHAMWLTRL